MKIRSLINFGEVLPLAAGVNVHSEDDGSFSVSYAVLKQEKDMVYPVKISSGIRSAGELKRELEKYLPEGGRLHINFEGKGVLQKVLKKNEAQKKHEELVSMFFPLIKNEEFASQRYTGQTEAFLQIVRKEALYPWFETLDTFAVVSFSLGAFIVSPLLPLLNDRSIAFGGYEVAQENNVILKVSAMPETGLPVVEIGKDTIPKDALLAYGSAWFILLGSAHLEPGPLETTARAKAEYDFHRHLYQASKWSLTAMLAILLINTGLYFWLTSRVESLATVELLSSDRARQHTEKQTKAQDLLTVYNAIGWSSNQEPVYYADQLAQLVRDGVQLTSLEIGVPDAQALKTEKQYRYLPTVIMVKGMAEAPALLQALITGIETLPWVKKVGDQRYRHDIRLNRGVFDFYIYIK